MNSHIVKLPPKCPSLTRALSVRFLVCWDARNFELSIGIRRARSRNFALFAFGLGGRLYVAHRKGRVRKMADSAARSLADGQTGHRSTLVCVRSNVPSFVVLDERVAFAVAARFHLDGSNAAEFCKQLLNIALKWAIDQT